MPLFLTRETYTVGPGLGLDLCTWKEVSCKVLMLETFAERRETIKTFSSPETRFFYYYMQKEALSSVCPSLMVKKALQLLLLFFFLRCSLRCWWKNFQYLHKGTLNINLVHIYSQMHWLYNGPSISEITVLPLSRTRYDQHKFVKSSI